MKRVICLALVLIIMTLVLCSCTYSCGMGNFNFKHLHYDTHSKNGCVDIAKWYENDTGIEIKTTDGTSLFFCEGTYILVGEKSQCPFCNEVT